jgi:hypothetical protein
MLARLPSQRPLSGLEPVRSGAVRAHRSEPRRDRNGTAGGSRIPRTLIHMPPLLTSPGSAADGALLRNGSCRTSSARSGSTYPTPTSVRRAATARQTVQRPPPRVPATRHHRYIGRTAARPERGSNDPAVRAMYKVGGISGFRQCLRVAWSKDRQLKAGENPAAWSYRRGSSCTANTRQPSSRIQPCPPTANGTR